MVNKMKVQATKPATKPVVKPAVKAKKQAFKLSYMPSVINTSDVLKTGFNALPRANTIEPRNAEALILGHKVDRINRQASKLVKGSTGIKGSGSYVGKVYNRPIKEGACLNVWLWMDAHPNATKQELVSALEGKVNKTTCLIQFKHWVDAK
jgi:hypothetical protein